METIMTTTLSLLQTLTRTRRRFLGSAATTMLAAHLGMTGSAQARTTTSTKEIFMNSNTASQSTPEGPGSVSGAPNLPAGFTDTFTSRYVDANGLRLHAVIGGEGPPLLLVHGWPQTWYQYRLIMPALAEDFEVIAVDQRGIGLSDKPRDGYDIGTLANDLVALMDALGHQRFALVGFDTGMFIAYAVAADHPERLDRMAVGEANVLGVSPSPPLFVPGPLNQRFWHLMFNQLPGDVNEALVRGREDVFIGAEYAAWAGTPLPAEVVTYYIALIASDPEALRGSFELYRAIEASAAQAEERKARRLTMPVLVIGGTASVGDLSVQAMKDVADDVQGVIIPGAGHWLAEEAPDEFLAALTAFLAPYRDGSAAVQDSRLLAAASGSRLG
jgi:pimeloyl-ACP methyl ester carboxylesterase